MMSEKKQRLERIKRFLKMQSSPCSVTEVFLGLSLGVSRKTIERDLLELNEHQEVSVLSGAPSRYFLNRPIMIELVLKVEEVKAIINSLDANTELYFDGDFKLDFELVFDENQLQTIVLALQSLKQMSPGVIKSLCVEVENTLVSKLPKALAKEFEHLKSISHAGATVLGEGGDIEAGVLQTVLLSLRKGKIFECYYSSPDEARSSKRKRSFAPLKLHFTGAPYLYVYDGEDKVIKLLRISRISSIKMTNEMVDKKRVKEINLEHVFGGYGKGSEKVINYAVLCTKPMAHKFNEQKIHPSQKIELLKAGLFNITFCVHDSLEVTRLLAQYGEFIRKIEPEAEYEKVKEIWKKGLGAA